MLTLLSAPGFAANEGSYSWSCSWSYSWFLPPTSTVYNTVHITKPSTPFSTIHPIFHHHPPSITTTLSSPSISSMQFSLQNPNLSPSSSTGHCPLPSSTILYYHLPFIPSPTIHTIVHHPLYPAYSALRHHRMCDSRGRYCDPHLLQTPVGLPAQKRETTELVFFM